MKNYENHPKYNGIRLDFDFSLLELEDELEFNDKVHPITLPNKDLNVPDGTMCEISGWGKEKEIHKYYVYHNEFYCK